MPVKRRVSKRRGKKMVTKKEVKSIAKQVFNKNVESKYFKTSSADSMTEIIPSQIQTLSNMTCQGFCTGNRVNVQTGGNWLYGTAQMKTLNLNRLYISTDGAPVDQFVLEGLYCNPSFAQSRFIVERMENDFSAASSPAARALPYYVRILRIMPRTQLTSKQGVDPTLDAFLDTNGIASGISTTNFSKLQLMTLKPNTRKYKVIQDIKYIENSPLTYNDLDIGDGAVQVRPTGHPGLRTFNFRHDLGKKLYYNNPDPTTPANTYPDSGFNNEFILFHFQTIGDSSTFATRSTAKGVRISANAVSSFKDA